MKKLFALITACLLTASLLAACGGSAASSSAAAGSEPAASQDATASQAESTAATGDTFTIGLIQLVEHPSLDEIRTAFSDEVYSQAEELGLTVDIQYQNAQNDTSMINSICRQFVSDKVDAIVAIATPAAQGAASATSDIPVIFSAVTDPVGAGLVDDLNNPDGNITGTSDAIAVDRIFELADELTPGITTYGLLYNKGEANSVSVIEDAKAYLDSKGIGYTEKTVTNIGEVQQTTRALLEECDALFSPIDNTVASAMQSVADECINAGKPVYVAADSMVNDGGLATVGVNYTQLGVQTADMTMRILSGAPISEVPVEVLTDLNVVVNPDTAAALGVDVSAYA